MKGVIFWGQDKLQIDIKKTGRKIKALCKERNITVKDIQKELYIGAFQTVYDWFSGKSLPSLDNLFRLSKMLNVHMEDFLVKKNEAPVICKIEPYYYITPQKRLVEYYRKIYSSAA